MRDSVIFYRSFYEAIKELPAEVQSQVYSAIFEYSLNFNELVLTGLPKAIFTLIKPQLDANNKRYENGKKGGKPNQSVTKAEPKHNQSITDVEPNKNVNVNDNVKVNENENILLEKETKENLLIVDVTKIPDTEERKKVALKKERFKPPSLQEVQEYCNERKNNIQAYTFINFYQSKGWKVGNQPMKDWKAAIHTWESKNKTQNGSTQSTLSQARRR